MTSVTSKTNLKKLPIKAYLRANWKFLAARWTIIPITILLYILMGNPWYITAIFLMCTVPFNLWIDYMAYGNQNHYYQVEQVQKILVTP